MFGKMVGNTKQGWALWAAMIVLFWSATVAAVGAEQQAATRCSRSAAM